MATPRKQFKMKDTPRKHKIRFVAGIGSSGAVVEAPLPEEFGFTVGSEFSAPFDANTLGGVLQKMKLPFAGGVSKRIGVVTTKFYSNPEPSEISFDVEFHAEVSARHEVIEPILALMKMSLGETASTENFKENVMKTVRGPISDILEALPGVDFDEENQDNIEDNITKIFDENVDENEKKKADKALRFIGLIWGPEAVTIEFGNVFTLTDAWISSVSCSFSNVVDAEGFPLSGTCSVTCILQRDPVQEDLLGFFGAEEKNHLGLGEE